MDDRALNRKYRAEAQRRGLVPAMNDTKWREVCDFFEQGDVYCPKHRTECLMDYAQDWDACWIHHFPHYSNIVYVELIPWEDEYLGALVPPCRTDHTEEIRAGLQQVGALFSVEPNGWIRIWGYIDPSNPPELGERRD